MRPASPGERRNVVGCVSDARAERRCGRLAAINADASVLAGHERRWPATVLVAAALLIWIANVAAAALGLWEMDRGGPFARDPRHGRRPGRPDLFFPQMGGVPGWDAEAWRPSFTDYLFVAFTAATAFSPTDTMPLSTRAKAMITAAAGVSLLTLAVVAARAVNMV